jgi:glycosyltransferase involved in cell wall biosynthesis
VKLAPEERVPLRHGARRYDLTTYGARLALQAVALLENRWMRNVLWLGKAPRAQWHSFDRTPWKHPWLTAENLRQAKAFSGRVFAEAQCVCESSGRRPLRFGFVSNIANNLYIRAIALRKMGLDITVYPVPSDDYVMSDPGWEEFDGTIQGSARTVSELADLGIHLPRPPGIFRSDEPWTQTIYSASTLKLLRSTRISDVLRWPRFFVHLSTLRGLQAMDALLTLQCPFLAYLSGRPYVVAQMGGDIWYEAARDDDLGRIQRRSFERASAYLASNPWAYAHARRYGMRHLLYLPQIIDEEAYSPGESEYRHMWSEQLGGTFFVLSTARADDFFKGNRVGIEGFARFVREFPHARLLMLGWGEDLSKHLTSFGSLGIADKVAVLPISGKKRLIKYLRAADCLLDQFVIGYFGATALEAMACGLPVIMRLEGAQYNALCETGAPPVFNASTSYEVYAALKHLALEYGARTRAALAHREWLVANHSGKRWHREYEYLLTATALGHRFDFNRSPLAAPLEQVEIEYHREELAHAPRFPSYH